MKPLHREEDAKRDFFVELPDHDFYEAEVECRTGCPTRTDARGYLIETARGHYPAAYAISRATNPFASICGAVCGAPCETACRRGDVDQPLAIRNIKGFLTQMKVQELIAAHLTKLKETAKIERFLTE